MPDADEPLVRLRGLIDELADREVDSLLAEARAAARARVLAQLTQTFAESIRDRVAARLTGAGRPEPDSATAPGPPNDPAPASPGSVPTPAPASARELSEPGALAWYVYGVIAADSAACAEGLPGIEADHPVASVTEGTLTAAVSHVRLEEFGETRLRHHLSDMGWVEATARAHEETLEHLRRRATVIPMRMCSVYRTEGGVREMLRREEQALADGLAHLDGKSEWGVKVFADPGLSRPPQRQPGVSDDATSGSTGTAYMERRREERDAAERVAQLIERAAIQIHEQLCAAAADGRASEVQPPAADDRGSELILNGVYLVRDDGQEAFHTRVRELRDTFGPLGLELRETGPWPAYNFVPGTIGAAW